MGGGAQNVADFNADTRAVEKFGNSLWHRNNEQFIA
jgi:hypothetical protein